MVMSNTSILRQFWTLSRAGLLTCVCEKAQWGSLQQPDIQKLKTDLNGLPSSQKVIKCSLACISHLAEDRCTALYHSSEKEKQQRRITEFSLLDVYCSQVFITDKLFSMYYLNVSRRWRYKPEWNSSNSCVYYFKQVFGFNNSNFLSHICATCLHPTFPECAQNKMRH